MARFMENMEMNYLVTFNDGEQYNAIALFSELGNAVAYARKQMRGKASKAGDGLFSVFRLEDGEIRTSYVL